MKVLIVCLGNICRSPIAEGLLTYKINTEGLDWTVDSAGTSGWHDGESPDPRAIKICRKHGIDISAQRSRKITNEDYLNFDLILAMDMHNLRDIQKLCPDDAYISKVKLFMDYSDDPSSIVPDPYYDNKFDLVYDMIDGALDALIDKNVLV
jgi:protein-tyrosine phosphatase